MAKVKGVLYFIVSALLGLWCLLSFLGIFSRLLQELPQDSYNWGVVIGQIFVYVIFGLLSARSFKAGKKQFVSIDAVENQET